MQWLNRDYLCYSTGMHGQCADVTALLHDYRCHVIKCTLSHVHACHVTSHCETIWQSYPGIQILHINALNLVRFLVRFSIGKGTAKSDQLKCNSVKLATNTLKFIITSWEKVFSKQLVRPEH